MGVNLLETDRQECYTIGMDWRGFSGLMYTVHKMGTIYVSKSLGDLRIPTHLRFIPQFIDSLALLLHLKTALSDLSDIVDVAKANNHRCDTPPILKRERSDSDFIFQSPKRRSPV
ncbi:predicted protein [Lichtheimia corymbifera JMRC:FSU:9682]|uniref:Uncharacterized protein n=1 Tax=Lichtheimia corymbifera JMRC:FSU:9682 TaxID=1263082 RepID=A0A068SFA6_9FUNG|nr:predicted protein [Lichtheimia corymbifera JMRC:FSU:9682]